MRRLLSLFGLAALASLAWAKPAARARHAVSPRAGGSNRPADQTHLPAGLDLLADGPSHPGALAAAAPAAGSDVAPLRLSSMLGKPKIVYCFNPDDDLAAIRHAGFTHVLVSYLQGLPDDVQRRRLDECQRAGLKLIYRLADLVDRDRRAGNDALVQHAVLLLRDHPALAGWETFEETNLPAAEQVAVYRKIKRWDSVHPVIIILTNEYNQGWYHRTYSDDAQDLVLMDYYPYKSSYDGWIYIAPSVRALQAEQKRAVPIIPVIQASSSAGVATAENTFWPPPGGLEKQLNLWWSLGADAGVCFWIWRGSKEYPFIGLADATAPSYALPETEALLARIPDGELPAAGPTFNTEALRHGEVMGSVTSWRRAEIPAVRVWQARENTLKNSGFERGLDGWAGYGGTASPTRDAYDGLGAARLENTGAPTPIGVGQKTDLLVPPNTTVTLSCYYKVVRETTGLQWVIGTTAYPKFGAAAFLEGKERLPPGGWRRASISATNSTGAAQTVTGVSVQSNAFTGEALLDDLQLELGPRATSYIGDTPNRPTRLVYRLRGGSGQRPVVLDQTRRRRGRGRAAETPSPGGEWTLSAWSAPEMPPGGDGYACLAAIEGGRPVTHPGAASAVLEVRLRVDPRRSDPNGWVGALEVADAGSSSLRLPVSLAPGQPLFWALSCDPTGALTLRAAPAGYRLASIASRGGGSGLSVHTVILGSDGSGGHPLNGLVSGGRLTPQALSLAAVEQERGAAGAGR